ncbi:MAG: hypothetical protein H6807_01595 [Planctomycetes bacterium]|nr:hypothetical protein [Planctomycetota bacterium]
MSPRPLLLTLLAILLVPLLPAQEPETDLIKKGLELARRLGGEDATDFIRVVKGKKTARLETAAVTYEDLDRELSVTLVAAVHIGDAAYYEALQKELAGYDLVLFEGIDRGQSEPDEVLLMVGRLQRMLKGALRLEFQPERMDMAKANMKRADISADELARELEAREVGLIPNENLVRAMAPLLEKGFAMLADDGKPESRIKAVIRDKLKRSMADVLGSGLGIYERFKREQDRLRDEVIIGHRNQHAFAMLEKEIAADPRRRFAIIYGAAHQPDFECRLVEDLGLVKTNTRWFSAWRMGKEQATEEPVREPVEEEEPPAPAPVKKI